MPKEHDYKARCEAKNVPKDWPDWMKPVDSRILELMERTRQAKLGGVWFKSATIAVNLEMSNDYVNKRMKELNEHDFVEQRDYPQGYYRITEEGTEFIRN